VIRAEVAPIVTAKVPPAPASAGDAEPRDFAGTPGPGGDVTSRAEPPEVEPPVPSGAAAGTQVPVPPAAEVPTTSPRDAGGSNVWGRSDDGTDEEGSEEVDRFSLAREFSQLLQEDSDGADG
jgi:hypothetical protein